MHNGESRWFENDPERVALEDWVNGSALEPVPASCNSTTREPGVLRPTLKRLEPSHCGWSVSLR